MIKTRGHQFEIERLNPPRDRSVVDSLISRGHQVLIKRNIPPLVRASLWRYGERTLRSSSSPYAITPVDAIRYLPLVTQLDGPEGRFATIGALAFLNDYLFEQYKSIAILAAAYTDGLPEAKLWIPVMVEVPQRHAVTRLLMKDNRDIADTALAITLAIDDLFPLSDYHVGGNFSDISKSASNHLQAQATNNLQAVTSHGWFEPFVALSHPTYTVDASLDFDVHSAGPDTTKRQLIPSFRLKDSNDGMLGYAPIIKFQGFTIDETQPDPYIDAVIHSSTNNFKELAIPLPSIDVKDQSSLMSQLYNMGFVTTKRQVVYTHATGFVKKAVTPGVLKFDWLVQMAGTTIRDCILNNNLVFKEALRILM